MSFVKSFDKFFTFFFKLIYFYDIYPGFKVQSSDGQKVVASSVGPIQVDSSVDNKSQEHYGEDEEIANASQNPAVLENNEPVEDHNEA